MFSSIRLGSGPLDVIDLYELRLSAELVTLSGCSTGLSVVSAGTSSSGWCAACSTPAPRR